MQESLSLRGVWFLPSKLDASIPGFLEYTPLKGVELQLMGVFDDAYNEQHTPELINGISADGRKITLYKCFRFQRGFNSNSFETSSYDAIYMMIGKHFASVDELRFEKISCVLADFDTWVGAFGFKKIESNDKTKNIIIEYERPEDLLFKATESINLAMRFNVEYPTGKRRSKATIAQTTGVNIWSTNGLTKFESLLEWFQTFHRLMTIAYFAQPLISRLSVGVKETINEEEQYIPSVDVYFQTETTLDGYKTIKSDNLFLFTYKEVKENFESILQKWFEIEADIEPTVAGLTEAFMKRVQPVEFKFLGLVQAIEALHRRTTDEAKYNNDQHRTKLTEIVSSIPEDYRNWIKEKLHFSHEPSLKLRLDDLVNRIPELVRKILLRPTPAKFMNQVKDSRNYYIHYDNSIKSRALKGGELDTLAERMKIFLVCLVLKEIGFTDAEVTNCTFRKGVFLFNHIIKYDEVKGYFND